MDGAMVRQPSNPFLIATLVAGAPHILGWPRGDSFPMSAEIMEAFLFAWLAGTFGRFVFGTAVPNQNGNLPRMTAARFGGQT
jgi:hypothetical protein